MIYYKTEEKEKGFRFYEPERNPDYNRKTEAVNCRYGSRMNQRCLPLQSVISRALFQLLFNSSGNALFPL